MAILSRNKKEPTKDLAREVGVAGDVVFESFDKEESRSDKVSIKEYRDMVDKDPTVESLFNIFTLPIIAATYRIDADEDDDNEEQAESIRKNLLQPPHKGGMESPFTLFQDELLLSIVDGFELWEKVYKLENGKYVLKKLAHRDCVGLTLIRDDDGGYGGVRQQVSYGNESVDVTLPAYKTFLFTHNKAREYLYGRSALRSLRKPYLKKQRLEYLDSIALQADAIKPKVLIRTENSTVGDDTDGSKTSGIKNKVLQALSMLGERKAVASIPYGYDIKEMTQNGRDPHQSIERQNSEMARAFLATFTLLGSQGGSNVGSYALSDNLSDMLMISLKAFMSKVEEHINQYVIADLINLNYANPHYPEFKYDDLTSDTVQVITDAFMKLLEKDHISDEMVQGIEEQAASRLEINLDQIKKDREDRAKQEAKEAANSSEKSNSSELSDIGARDFPGLYKELGVNEDNLGCIMLDLQPFDVLKHIPDGQNDLYTTDKAHSGGAVAETEAHVTLLYGLLQNGNTIKDQVDTVLSGWKCDSVVLDTIDSFPVAPDAPSVPIVAKLWNSDLQDANKRLSLLPHVNTFTEYNPHVTIAYVKNDPDIVQKWVKALNQVIAGMRIASTGINYGDLPKDDEEDDANSGGKFLSDGLEWRRPLTPAEQSVSLADLTKRMDGMEEAFTQSMAPIVDKLTDELVTAATSAKSAADISVELPADYSKTIFTTIRTAYNYAKNGAADDLEMPAPATSKEAITGMKELTQFVVDKQQDDLKNLLRSEYLKAQRTKQLADSEEESSTFSKVLKVLLGAWFLSKLRDTATSIVSQGVNNGRNDTFESIGKPGDRMEYSAILDDKVCPLCESLDGKVLTYEEWLKTKWKPPFHFHDRCIWILLRKLIPGKTDTTLPEITGIDDEKTTQIESLQTLTKQDLNNIGLLPEGKTKAQAIRDLTGK